MTEEDVGTCMIEVLTDEAKLALWESRLGMWTSS